MKYFIAALGAMFVVAVIARFSLAGDPIVKPAPVVEKPAPVTAENGKNVNSETAAKPEVSKATPKEDNYTLDKDKEDQYTRDLKAAHATYETALMKAESDYRGARFAAREKMHAKVCAALRAYKETVHAALADLKNMVENAKVKEVKDVAQKKFGLAVLEIHNARKLRDETLKSAKETCCAELGQAENAFKKSRSDAKQALDAASKGAFNMYSPPAKIICPEPPPKPSESDPKANPAPAK